MKFDIATDMLFELLNHRKLTAQYFAQKYKISVRTVFRYVDVLSLNVPVETQSGRTGGIYISDAYKLPVGFMRSRFPCFFHHAPHRRNQQDGKKHYRT